MIPKRFIADVHLGKLARKMRMLGFDTLYQNDFRLEDMISVAIDEERLILSRNHAFKRYPLASSLILLHENPQLQLKQLLRQFALLDHIEPFTRCILCSDCILAVSKEEIWNKLLENTARHYREFWQCTGCQKIYWKGSHYEKMKALLDDLQSMSNH